MCRKVFLWAFAFALYSTSISGQNRNEPDLNLLLEKHNRLDAQIDRLDAQLYAQNMQIEKLNAANEQLKKQLKQQADLIMAQAVQLEEQQTKIEGKIGPGMQSLESSLSAQDQSLSEVKSTLSGRYTYLLIAMLAALLLIPVIAVTQSRKGLKQGLNKAQGNWDRFQEHILRKS